MKRLIIVFIIIITAFITYEYYLFLNPIKWEYQLDSNGDKVYGCDKDLKCTLGSYCDTKHYGKNLPAFSRECKLFIKFKK